VSEWRTVPLGDVLTLQRGFDLPARDREEGPFPIVSSAGVTGWHASAKADPPGVVIGRYGSLGSVHWITGPYWPLNTALWVKDFKGNDPRFVSYLLRTVAVDGSTASAVPGVNRNHLHRIPVRVPSVTTQRRIASLLASIDELVEINDRRIELLEDLARSLYREWFVRFRFPGHDQAEFVEMALGRRPSTWAAGRVSDFFALIGGGTPPKAESDYWADGTIDWYTPSDLTRRRTRFVDDSATRITELGLAKSSARAFAAGSVLMTSRATLGVLAIATRRAGCNQGFIVIPPTPGVPPMFIYEWLADKKDELEAIATGATFKEITKGAMKRFPFVMPSPDVLERFGAVAEPIGAAVALLERTNRHLQVTSDLLLPRLVTGRLDISDIDLGTLLPADAEAA
jgi:type I restriction enzyme S subunit